jgi:hypothetical protein
MRNFTFIFLLISFLACNSDKSKKALEIENRLLMGKIDSLKNPFKDFDKRNNLRFEEVKQIQKKVEKEEEKTRNEEKKHRELTEIQEQEAERQRQQMDNEVRQRTEYAKQEMVRNNIFNYLKTYSDYTAHSLGGLSNVYAGIKNQSDYWIDEVGLTLTYLTANGYVYTREYITIKGIQAHGSRSEYAPNSTRGTTLRVRINYIYSSALNLRQSYQ